MAARKENCACLSRFGAGQLEELLRMDLEQSEPDEEEAADPGSARTESPGSVRGPYPGSGPDPDGCLRR